jgi:hypothetical protein
MKMPDTISENMLAVCGMNCLACYKHCAAKSERQQCPGCLSDSASKPNHCRVCKIAACAGAKGHTRCFECGEFPCGLIKRLEKSYNTRYGESLVANGVFAREKGGAAFMENARKNRAGPDGGGGGVVSLHDKVCGECGKQAGDSVRITITEQK